MPPDAASTGGRSGGWRTVLHPVRGPHRVGAMGWTKGRSTAKDGQSRASCIARKARDRRAGEEGRRRRCGTGGPRQTRRTRGPFRAAARRAGGTGRDACPRATHGPASHGLRRCCMRRPRPPPSLRYCRRPAPQTLAVRMTRPRDERRHVRLFDGERTVIDQRRYPGTHRDRPRQNRNRAGSLAKGPGPIARRAGCCDVPACRPPRLGTEAMLTVDGSNLGTDIVRLGMT